MPAPPPGLPPRAPSLIHPTYTPPPREDWWLRTAQRPAAFALVFLAAGFAAVFLHQADDVTQLVFGAPIFEEAFKFGVALLLASSQAMRAHWVRIPVALAVGAGFGWLEHVITYEDESQQIFWGRLGFHAASTGLSMTAYQVLLASSDARARWTATLPASLLHYANNTGQLWLGAWFRTQEGPQAKLLHEDLGHWLFFGVIAACVIVQGVLWLVASPYRRKAARLAGGVLERL